MNATNRSLSLPPTPPPLSHSPLQIRQSGQHIVRRSIEGRDVPATQAGAAKDGHAGGLCLIECLNHGADNALSWNRALLMAQASAASAILRAAA